MRRFLIPLLASLALPAALNAENTRNAFSTVQCEKKNHSSEKLVNLIKSATVTLKTTQTFGQDNIGIGIIIAKDEKYTYILSDSRGYRESPGAEATWEDGSKNYVQLVYSFAKEDYQAEENDLALYRFVGNKGGILPLQEDLPLLGSEVISLISSDGPSTFNLLSGKVQAYKKYKTTYATDLDIEPLTSGSPLVDSYGCLIGIYANEYGKQFSISNKQISSMLKNYAKFKQKIHKILNQYPIKEGIAKWPSDWNIDRIEGETKSRIKEYATINFASSLSEGCEVFKEAKKQKNFHYRAHRKVEDSILPKIRSGELSEEKIEELLTPTHEKLFPWQFKLLAAKVDLLRLMGHEDWQLYSRYSSYGVFDLLNIYYGKRANKESIDNASESIFNFYYWGLVHNKSSDAICKKYDL